MEKTKWGNIIFEVLITILLTSLFSFVISIFFNRNQCDINIGTSIVNGNEFMTPITIKNNSGNIEVEDLDITVGEYNEIINMVSNITYTIENKKKAITLNYIPPKETVSIIIITKDVINLDSVKIAYKGNLNITYLEDKSETYTLIISQAIIYGIMLIVIKYLQDKNHKKQMMRIDEVNKTVEKNDKEINDLLTEQKDLKSEAAELKKDKHKLRIYYLTRMKDYKKELDFWKDTIRKFIYQSSLNKVNSEELFDVVTDTLKTYGTKSKDIANIDEIFYLAHIMNENNKGNETEL